jgi:hypothetical protein
MSAQIRRLAIEATILSIVAVSGWHFAGWLHQF